MGAERPSSLSHQEKIDASSARKKRNTAPGVGPPSGEGAAAPAHAPVSHDDDAPTPPDVVDFDALHAALGELPPPPTSSSPSIGESQGRPSATYSSARPHTIPPTRAPIADELNAPPVIIQTEDTVPTGPPQQMTVPMASAPPYGGPAGPRPVGMARPESPNGPFAATAVVQPPAPMPDPRVLPMPPPRRPRTPTIVVRTRGPTKQQKLLVFMAMLLVFVGGGIAFLVYGKQLGLDIDFDLKPRARPSATAPAAPTVTMPTATATATATATTTATATPTSLPSASAASATPSSLPAATTPAAPSAKKPARRPAAPPPPPPPPPAIQN